PYNCSYCSNHALAKTYGKSSNTPRYRSVEKSILEIQEVINKVPVRRIAIGDDIFGLNKSWRKEFCEEYSKKIKIPFFCLLRVNVIDEEFLSMLKAAGCYRISFGVESGNEYIRNEVMNRNISTDQIIYAFELAKKHGLETNAINIIGTPGETEEMIWDTINLNRKIKPTSSGVNIFYPYKGTKLGNECFSNKLVDQKNYLSSTSERKESILNYPEAYKRKLSRYQKYWDFYVYRSDPGKIIIPRLRQNKFLRKLKRLVT
ncbi:MAG TPA: radical SAM protein, partial [bacterium]|nr:radical SAM protein [bacterium]